jgi:hypothetical protein
LQPIERNKIVKEKECRDDNDYNNKNKKNNVGKFDARAKKVDCPGKVYFFARTVGATAHMIPQGQDPTVREENLTSNNKESKKDRPFSCHTFCKEVNTLARKAGKKNALSLYAYALKRKQDKESKVQGQSWNTLRH